MESCVQLQGQVGLQRPPGADQEAANQEQTYHGLALKQHQIPPKKVLSALVFNLTVAELGLTAIGWSSDFGNHLLADGARPSIRDETFPITASKPDHLIDQLQGTLDNGA